MTPSGPGAGEPRATWLCWEGSGNRETALGRPPWKTAAGEGTRGRGSLWEPVCYAAGNVTAVGLRWDLSGRSLRASHLSWA